MKMSQKNKNNNDEKQKGLMEGGSGTANTNVSKKESLKLYPKPLAKFCDVSSDTSLFMRTLEQFHSAMNTKFMIPIIGGKDLDLHKLFNEVTSRGGIDKVIADRRWKEVTASFTFPSTATNASFILRKYYYSLLYHYEQLYFFGSEGCNDTTDNMPSPLVIGPKRPLEVTFDSPTILHKRKIRDELPLPATPMTGVIDGKFEHGYLVTVKIGSNTLRGALFYCMDEVPTHSINIPQSITFNPSPAFTAGTSNPQAGSQYASGSGSPDLGMRRQRRRRKKRPSTMDPNHPKPNRSGYNFFFAEQHAQLKPLHPGKDRDISRMIGERWNSLTEAEKNVYQERGRVDKQRYQSELVLYREKQKTEPGHVISDAVPINQRPASESDFTVEGIDIKVEEGDLVLAKNNDHNSDTDDTDESDDGDKNQDLDLDTGFISGSDSVSDSSLAATTLVTVERQSTGDAGPSRQTVPDGFELQKREVVGPLVEAESNMVVDYSSKAMEGGVKSSEGFNTLVEAEVKTSEGHNELVEGDLKAGEGSNNLVEGDVKMGEGSNDPVGGDVKTGERYNDPVQGNVKMVEGSTDPVEDGVKLGEDANDSVEGDLKMAEGFNDPTVGDVPMGKDVEVTKEEKMIDVG